MVATINLTIPFFQTARTRRLNYDRSRRNALNKKHEKTTAATTKPSSILGSSSPSLPESSATEKVPLPRLPTVGPSQNLSSSKNNQATNPHSSTADKRALNCVQSAVSKGVDISQTSSSTQAVGVPVATSTSCMPCTRNVALVTGTPSTPSITSSAGNSNSLPSNEQSSHADAMEGMFDVLDDGASFNDGDFGHSHPSAETTPVIVIDDENSKDQPVITVEEHSLHHSNLSQNELQLRSPKRKG